MAPHCRLLARTKSIKREMRLRSFAKTRLRQQLNVSVPGQGRDVAAHELDGHAAVVVLQAARLARALVVHDHDEVATHGLAARDAQLGFRQGLEAVGRDFLAATDAVLH